MKLPLLVILLLWQATLATEAPRYLRYERVVTLPANAAEGAPTCATLDAAVYAHAAATLKDLRLYEGERQVPYAITLSDSVEADSEPATLVNLGQRGTGSGSRIVFDLRMPPRPYTDVALDLDAHDFIAAAQVSGMGNPGAAPTRLGTFTLFDLAAQHLGRSTTLHLQESTFPVLHVELNFASAPGSPPAIGTPAASGTASALVRGATVPPSREAQTVYTTVAKTTALVQRGHQTIATIHLPPHVPAERVVFSLAPNFTANFSRFVSVTAHPDAANSAAESLTGTILRVRLDQAGREIRQEELGIPATLGANLQSDATVEVQVDNGNDVPLPIVAVQLAMRQRRLCFAAPIRRELSLFYGDSALETPTYDYGRLLSPTAAIIPATLGPEQQNSAYTPRPAAPRAFTERHPELLWIVLLAVVCVLAIVATHSAQRMPK